MHATDLSGRSFVVRMKPVSVLNCVWVSVEENVCVFDYDHAGENSICWCSRSGSVDTAQEENHTLTAKKNSGSRSLCVKTVYLGIYDFYWITVDLMRHHTSNLPQWPQGAGRLYFGLTAWPDILLITLINNSECHFKEVCPQTASFIVIMGVKVTALRQPN